MTTTQHLITGATPEEREIQTELRDAISTLKFTLILAERAKFGGQWLESLKTAIDHIEQLKRDGI